VLEQEQGLVPVLVQLQGAKPHRHQIHAPVGASLRLLVAFAAASAAPLPLLSSLPPPQSHHHPGPSRRRLEMVLGLGLAPPETHHLSLAAAAAAAAGLRAPGLVDLTLLLQRPLPPQRQPLLWPLPLPSARRHASFRYCP
jgi:hypothetical protein